MTPHSVAATPAPLIYVVEDDDAVSRLVVAALREFGFATEAFRNGTALLRRLQTERPDLCIVDLGLPDMDGIDLVRQVAAVSSSGVLILTARGHTVDRVMGLELGGDDYMVKPFEPRELVARVRSILRRRAGGRAQPGISAATPASWAGRSTALPTSCARPTAPSTCSVPPRRTSCGPSSSARTRS